MSTDLKFKIILLAMTLLSFGCTGYESNNTNNNLSNNGEWQQKVLQSMISEIERLDGEVLDVRKNRTKSWSEISQSLVEEASKTSSVVEFVQTLRRLDASYPNLHAQLGLNNEWQQEYEAMPSEPTLPFMAEVINGQVRYIIHSLPTEFAGQLNKGDELIAINDISIDTWRATNFEFCKHPLKIQCDKLLNDKFVERLLPFNNGKNLRYTIRSSSQIVTVGVPLVAAAQLQPNSSSDSDCSTEQNRYQNFTMIHQGRYACIFQSNSDPATVILRIISFHYEDNEGSVQSEVDAFRTLWQNQSSSWSHLVIDLIDNFGGDFPIPYYKLILQNEFEEHFFQAKNIVELQTTDLMFEVFVGQSSLIEAFNDISNSPDYSQLSPSDFLPAMPMFCPDDQDCFNQKIQPDPHSFSGKVSILANEFCISSCDGFIFTLKENLGEQVKVFGFEQSADTGFSRLKIEISPSSNNDDGFEMNIVSEQSENLVLFSQSVVVTKSQYSDGRASAGKPVALEQRVDFTLDNHQSWHQDVLNTALGIN